MLAVEDGAVARNLAAAPPEVGRVVTQEAVVRSEPGPAPQEVVVEAAKGPVKQGTVVKSEPAVNAHEGVSAEIDTRSADDVDRIQLELLKFKLNLLVDLNQLPLKGRDDVGDMVNLTTKLRQALVKVRSVCRDKHPTVYVRGWEDVLNRYIMKYVKLSDPRAATTSQVITNAFVVVRTLLDAGETSGPDAMDVLVRELCENLSSFNPADVFQQLQTYAVAEGTTFKTYFVALKLLVNNVRLMAFCGDGTLQFAIKQSTTDQFAVLTAPVYSGRNLKVLPFASVEELLNALEDLAQNTATATKSTRAASQGASAFGVAAPRSHNSYGRGGGFHTRAGSHAAAGGQIMVVGSAEYDDEVNEFLRVHAIADERNIEPFNVKFHSHADKDRARRAFGAKCLNCGVEEPFHMARECTEGFINASRIINDKIGEGDVAEVEKKWRAWQQRLCAWAETFHKERAAKQSFNNKQSFNSGRNCNRRN